MPKRGAVALVTTILAVVLLFSFRTSDPTTATSGLPNNGFVGQPAVATPGPVAVGPRPTSRPAAGATPAPRQSLAPGVTPAPTETPAPQQPDATPPPANTGTETVDGDAVQTAYGTVQIALVVQNGKIVDVQELQMPSDRRLSQQISAQAGPMLRSQTLRAQSADINGVSGASYTSHGFWESLQSALAKM